MNREDTALTIIGVTTIAIGFFVGYWLAIHDLKEEYENKVIVREIVHPQGDLVKGYDESKKACVQ